jgi:hypothetical protein
VGSGEDSFMFDYRHETVRTVWHREGE